MKKYLIFLFFISWGLFAQDQDIKGGIYVSAVDSERIISYNVNILVDTTSKLTITERITVNAQGQDIKRGIYRTLPTYRNLNGRSTNVKYDVVSILKNGAEEKYHTKKSSGAYTIYVGDKDNYLDPGAYAYEITYTTDRQIGYFEKFDELYWNVTGTDWSFPIDDVSVTINLPQNAEILQNACYTGVSGSTEQNCESQITASNSIRWHSQNLNSYEGLTVAVGFKKGLIPEPVLPKALGLGRMAVWFSLLGGLLLGLMFFLWNKHGRDFQTPTVFPQFDTPDNLSPAAIGFISNGYYSNSYIVASLVNLAIKGYLKIVEIPKRGLFGRPTFVIEKMDNLHKPLNGEEKSLYEKLFKSDVKSIEIDNEYSPHFAGVVKDFQTNVSAANTHYITNGSNWLKSLMIFGTISAIYCVAIYFVHRYFQEPKGLVFGILFYVISFVIFLIPLLLRSKTAKYFWVFPVIGVVVFMILWKGSFDQYEICYLFLLLSVSALAFFSYIIKQPSEEYLRISSLIKGFKMYLEAAENELIKFHNPPNMTPEVFEKYLPYAMVLGADKVWGKKFENSLHNNNNYNSTHWYTGGTYGSLTSNLNKGLNQSLVQTVSSASTDPSSSGSGGGGSSGGGGGGGGGGGW